MEAVACGLGNVMCDTAPQAVSDQVLHQLAQLKSFRHQKRGVHWGWSHQEGFLLPRAWISDDAGAIRWGRKSILFGFHHSQSNGQDYRRGLPLTCSQRTTEPLALLDLTAL